MEAWIEFGRGPLFRLAFGLMVLGLLRVVVLTLVGIAEATGGTPTGLFPGRASRGRRWAGWCRSAACGARRPVYSSTSFLFHVGLLAVPLFLAAHVRLWRGAVGFAWPGMPQTPADYLTLLTIAAGLGLFCGRVFHRAARALSRLQDYVWPPLLIVPFATGYVCSHAALRAEAYQALMLAARLRGRPDPAHDPVHQDRALRADAVFAGGDRGGLEVRPGRG